MIKRELATSGLKASAPGFKGATLAHVALAWRLARTLRIMPIPGTTRLDRLEEDLAAADLERNDGDLFEIARALADIEIAGERHPVPLLATTGR